MENLSGLKVRKPQKGEIIHELGFKATNLELYYQELVEHWLSDSFLLFLDRDQVDIAQKEKNRVIQTLQGLF